MCEPPGLTIRRWLLMLLLIDRLDDQPQADLLAMLLRVRPLRAQVLT